jgi:hypothetical protein
MNDLEGELREGLRRRADDVRVDPAAADRIFRRARRGRIVGLTLVAAGAAVIVAAIAVMLGTPPVGRGPGPGTLPVTPSASPEPAACGTGGPNPSGQCGWVFGGDLDGDGRRDRLALIVDLGVDGSTPESAELRVKLATGPEEVAAVEVIPEAGFPQPVHEIYLVDPTAPDPGVIDLDGDGRDEVLLSLFQSGAGRAFIRVFVLDGDRLREVTAAGETHDSPRRAALRDGGAPGTGFGPFELVVGGSTGLGGGLECGNVDSDPEAELTLRFYRYGQDPDEYELSEARYELEGATATEVHTDTRTVSPDVVAEGFWGIGCQG